MKNHTPPQAHHIGKIHFDVGTATFESALRLRARAEELAWKHIPKIIEEVFDALAPADRHVRIKRLDLNLGDITADALEKELPAAFERALRESLTDAIATALHAPNDHARALSPSAALLEEFDTYLVNGTTPFRHADNAFGSAEIIQHLITEQPAALAELLRRHARDGYAIERLVLQAGEEGLRALLDMLAPADVAIIVAYHTDFRQIHRQVEPARLTEPALHRTLWVLTLKYLLHEAGTQFNRRSYLASLIKGVALTEGISYAALLALMQAVAMKTRASQPLAGSLLSVLDELDVFQNRADLTDDRAVGFEGSLLLSDLAANTSVELTSIDAFACAEAGDLEPLLNLLQRTASQPIAMEILLQSISAPVFASLIAQMQPPHATLILAHITDLTTLHHQRPQLSLSESAFEYQLRLLTLRYLLLDAGSQFNRLSWLRRLLNELAAATSVTYRFLLTSFATALDGLRERLPLSSSLPEGLALLISGLTSQDNSLTDTTLPAATIVNPDTAIAIAERFLRTGHPQTTGLRLSDLAVANPNGFAALLRRLLTAASGNAEALIERLLTWMLPEEIVATLLPGQTDQAARWADMLANQPGASMASAWTEVLDAALHGKALSGPDALAWPAERLDRLALLRHWIDQGALPWWAAPNVRVDTLLTDLSSQTLAMLYTLFNDPEPEQIVLRLRRMFYRIGAASGLDIIARLAPWAFTPGGPLAVHEAGLSGDALNDLRIRATAAAIAGVPLDLEQLAKPILLPPDTQAPVAEPQDQSAQENPHLLFAWLAGASSGAFEPTEKSFRLLANLLASNNPALNTALHEGLTQPDIRQRWTTTMPDEILSRLIHRITPTRGRFMIDLKTVMQAAWRQTAPPGTRENAGKHLWSALLTMLAEPTHPAPRMIAKQLLACLVNTTPVAVDRLLSQTQWLAKQGGYANLTGALLTSALQVEAAKPQQQRTPSQEERRMPTTRSPTTQDGDALYISNAGLILCHPFLPHFFKQLELLSVDHDGVTRIIGIENASHAVHLLQYLVDGRCDAPEPELALNKLLCGIALDAPVARSIEPSESDQAVCDNMMQAIIANWPSIKNTSPAGLRETFLQRTGRLLRRDGKWTLTVSRKTVDVLIDQIPWGFSIILHPWMPNELSVTW